MGADVVEISSSDDEDSEVRLLSSDSDTAAEVVDDKMETSGNHVNDELNQCDASGRVLVNIGHPPDDSDIFMPPQIAAAVKPHQVYLTTYELVEIVSHFQNFEWFLSYITVHIVVHHRVTVRCSVGE